MHSKFHCVSEGVFDVHKYDSFGLERLICVHVLVIWAWSVSNIKTHWTFRNVHR